MEPHPPWRVLRSLPVVLLGVGPALDLAALAGAPTAGAASWAVLVGLATLLPAAGTGMVGWSRLWDDTAGDAPAIERRLLPVAMAVAAFVAGMFLRVPGWQGLAAGCDLVGCALLGVAGWRGRRTGAARSPGTRLPSR